jgi:transposase-like protein
VTRYRDGAFGFWAALRELFPETLEARCWVHKAANVLNAVRKSAQPAARKALAEIRDAEDQHHALAAIKVFKADYGATWPKAVAKSPVLGRVVKKRQQYLDVVDDLVVFRWASDRP